MEAFSHGTSVTAKVSWLTHSAYSNSNTSSSVSQEPGFHIESRPRWIHCTPLLGSDCKPGVYMIVMVDKEEITGALNARQHNAPVVHSTGTGIAGNGAAGFSPAKLYADYLRREGTAPPSASDSTYTRRGPTPRNANHASLEDDIAIGRVNSGLARMNLSPRTATPIMNDLSSLRSYPASTTGERDHNNELGARSPAPQGLPPQSIHFHNVSMDVGATTPYCNKNMGEDGESA